MHVVVNAAMSADGKLASHRREQLRISGPTDLDRVDALRAESDAVMVGVETVLADDPNLTLHNQDRAAAREADDRPRHPARVVADSRARTPIDARVLDDRAATYLLTSEVAPAARIEALRDATATVVTAGVDRVDLTAALAALEADGLERLMVEGGGEIVFSLFEAGLVDELSVYVGSMVVGGRDAPTLADGAGFGDDFPALELIEASRLDDGVVLQYAVDGAVE